VILLIDIGNTRIKWATLDGQIGPMRALAYAGYDASRLQTEMLSSAAKPTRVLIANVAGPIVAQALTAAIRSEWQLAPEFIVSTSQAGGVRNAYPAPEKLGVDRWLGAIAAHRNEQRAVCVASVGTAMTIDGVDAHGLHLGGAIVPGPDLMIDSLLRNTSDIAAHSQGGTEGSELFANNTLAAIQQGALHALAALIERAVVDMQASIGEPPTLLLTGGASSRIQPALRVPFKSVPNLVLQGLAVLAQA
jgi:type III pantothenate kinase